MDLSTRKPDRQRTGWKRRWLNQRVRECATDRGAIDRLEAGILRVKGEIDDLRCENRQVVAGVSGGTGNSEFKICASICRHAEPVHSVDAALVKAAVLFLVAGSAL